MSIEVALPLAFIVAAAGFFAYAGRVHGLSWVAVPLLVGAGISTVLLLLHTAHSPFFTPAAIATVFCPVAVAFANRVTGYRWWSSFAINRRLLVAWLVLGVLLMVASVGLLVTLAFSSR